MPGYQIKLSRPHNDPGITVACGLGLAGVRCNVALHALHVTSVTCNVVTKTRVRLASEELVTRNVGAHCYD